MKASYKKNDHRFVIIMLIIASVCCLLTNAAYNSGVSNFASSIVGIVVTPVQKLAANVHEGMADLGEYFGNVKQLKAENKQLKEEITHLSRENSELAPLKEENEMLHHFLGLKTDRTDIQFVNAEIISRSVSNYTSDFSVDKGSVHGIKKNMAVMTEDGSLLGIIIEVGATYSRGKTLTSYDFSAGIKNERTGEPGILSGSFELSRENLCHVTDLYDSTDYAVGDVIRTSSLGDIYPPGLYVGTVKELVPDKYGYTVSAVVEPSATVSDTGMVMIVTDFERTYEEDIWFGSADEDVLPNANDSILPALPDGI